MRRTGDPILHCMGVPAEEGQGDWGLSPGRREQREVTQPGAGEEAGADGSSLPRHGGGETRPQPWAQHCLVRMAGIPTGRSGRAWACLLKH